VVAPNTPVYGIMSASTGDHVYTPNAVEVTNAQTLYGYTSLGVVFQAWSTQAAGRVPVYRLAKAAGGGHMYTVSASERDSAVATLGFTYEGVAFYGSSSSASGLVPVYRYWCASIGDHKLGTTSIAPSGCVTQALQFWAGP
jgi:hypothetical protein